MVWWALRPRGGWPAVRRRARDWLAAQGVRLLHVADGASLSITPSGGAESTGAKVSYGTGGAEHFDHVIIATEPAAAATALRGDLATSRDWRTALSRLAEFSQPLQLELITTSGADDNAGAPPSLLSWLDGPTKQLASCMLPPPTPAATDGGTPTSSRALAYHLRDFPHSGFDAASPASLAR
jgi:hypothetical protein